MIGLRLIATVSGKALPWPIRRGARVPGKDQEASNQRNKSFELENPFETTIGHWLRFGNGGDQFTLDDRLAGIDQRNLPNTDRHHVKEALKEHGCKPPSGQVRCHGVKAVAKDSLPSCLGSLTICKGA